MASLDEVRAVREEKLKILKDAGMNPFPSRVESTHSLFEIREQFDDLEKSGTQVSVVGRVMGIRGQGAILFVPLYDGTERFQIVVKKDEMDEALFDLFSQTVEPGDFVQFSGTVFMTQRGEQSVPAKTWI